MADQRAARRQKSDTDKGLLKHCRPVLDARAIH